MSAEPVEEVKNEEATEITTNENIEEEPKKEIKEEPKEEATTEPINNEVVEEAKPKAKAKAKARTVKVVELVECSACNKKMLPKSLRNTHPHYCKGAPTETLPVNKQKASYGTKVEQRLRKEIEEEMKKKYASNGSLGGSRMLHETSCSATYENKENDKNAQNVKNEVVHYSEPIEVKTKAKPVRMEREASRCIREETPPRQLTARELLEASYAEIRRAKREEHMQKINSFKSKMF